MIPELVAERYGVAVREVRLLPGGYHASAYLLDGAYVLKFYSSPPSSGLWAASAVSGTAPLPSLGGSLVERLDDGRFVALFPFVVGETPDGWPLWPASVLSSIGVLLRRLHELPASGLSAPGLPVSGLPVDNLDVPFAGELSGYLARGGAFGGASDGAWGSASGAGPVGGGLPLSDEIAVQLDRLFQLQAAAAATSWEPVICHTDVGGDNILVTPSGEVVLLDWDEAVIGPPENDFVLFARDEPPGSHVLAAVLHGYGAGLDPDRLVFCQLRRYLADATVRLARLLDPSCADPDAVRADLVEWGVRPWRALRAAH